MGDAKARTPTQVTRAKRPTMVRKGCDTGGLVFVCVHHVLDLPPNSVSFDLFNFWKNQFIPRCQLLNRLLAFVPDPIVVTKAWRLARGKARHEFKERQHAARTQAHAAGGRMVEKGSTRAERKRGRRKRGL